MRYNGIHLRVVEVYNASDGGVSGPLQHHHIALARHVLNYSSILVGKMHKDRTKKERIMT